MRLLDLVPRVGLEPTRPQADQEPQSCAYANSATAARQPNPIIPYLRANLNSF